MVNKPMKPERVQHRRRQPDRTLIHGRRPVEDLDRRRNRDDVAQHREHHAGVNRLAADEQMMAPHEEAEHRDRDARERDEAIAERLLRGERGDDLADHAHRRQNHDVHGRVRVEPEEMLEQAPGRRQAPDRRYRYADPRSKTQQEQSYRNHRSAQDLNQAGGVVRPDEQRQAEPGHARRAHAVNGDDEVQPGQNRRESVDENAQRRQSDVAIGVAGAEWRVEGPAGIDAARQSRHRASWNRRSRRGTSSAD